MIVNCVGGRGGGVYGRIFHILKLNAGPTFVPGHWSPHSVDLVYGYGPYPIPTEFPDYDTSVS